jgi:alpha-tubulin suppressor-like RCC1 family protein
MSTRELVLVLVLGFVSALRLYSVGSNTYGLAGDGTGQYVAIPQNISARTSFSNFYASKISIGFFSNHVLTRENLLYGWVCLKKYFN